MKVVTFLLDLLYPPRCAFCHDFIETSGDGLCAHCRTGLPFAQNGGRQHFPFIPACVSPLNYEGNVRESLLRYKFGGATGYAKVYGRLVAGTVRAELAGEYDLVTWVPLSRRRLRERGYDQARLLAKATAKELGLPLTPTLHKQRNTQPQSRTGDAAKRRANITGAYRMKRGADVTGKRVLLIDDVVTTGATLSECARVLGKAGAEQVVCALLTKTAARRLRLTITSAVRMIQEFCFMMIFERDIAIDLGTTNIRVFVRGKGIMLREPSIVAVDKYTGRMLKVGQDAQKMLGRTPANIVAIHPISAGVISDYDMTALMLKELLSRVTSFSLFKPRVLVTVPSSVTGVEERNVIDAVIEAGARKVYLVESAVATAAGAGADISKPDGHLVIDIGGGTTEVAVVSLGGVVESESIKTAGDAFDEAIVRYVRRKHNILIGKRTAEELKIGIACLVPRAEVGIQEVKGRCLTTGLPKSVKISSVELVEAIAEPARDILETIHMVLERTPPELVADVAQNGIIMAGGGSLIYGFDQLVEKDTGIRTTVVDDALSCAAFGSGKMLMNLNDMQDGMVNLARKRQMKA